MEQDRIQLAPENSRIIAVLQRGHVAVGTYSQKGEIAQLDDCAIVRRWGTSKGLGELAKKGPLPNTKLDQSPALNFHVREAIFVMRCSDAWNK